MSGDFLAVQLLGCSAFTVLGLGSIPGRGIKVLQAARHGQKREEKKKVHVQSKVLGIYITNKVEKDSCPCGDYILVGAWSVTLVVSYSLQPYGL